MHRRLIAVLGACLAGLVGSRPATPAGGGLAQAERNYPPLILGANTRPTDGRGPFPPACPAGGRVEQRGGLVTEYLGADPARPELCRMRVNGTAVEGWFGIWLTTWPGADMARGAIERLIQGRTGDVVGFDVNMGPGHVFHDVQRNEGIESITLLSATYQALKISHYREGADRNTYRSVTTGWKDLASGMIIYATYQHISGAPEINVPIIPTAIIRR